MRNILHRPSRPRAVVAVAGMVLTLGVTIAHASGPTLPVVGAVLEADRCDPLDLTDCLLPFPSDFYTVKDPTTKTGRRVNLSLLSMPANTAGKHIDPTEWNRNDGFSPGTPLLVHVPGIDLVRSRVATVDRPADSLRADAPIVLLDATTGKRWPYWAELDANVAPTQLNLKGIAGLTADVTGLPNPFAPLPIQPIDRVDGGNGAAQQALIIRPATNFPEGHRIVVALRNLRTKTGVAITPSTVFQDYRDRKSTGDATMDQRQGAMDRIFADLAKARVARSSTYLAWDFTIASADNLAGRMLHIRDDAFASLQGTAPAFNVQEINDLTVAQNDKIAREIKGSFTVPSYLTLGGQPGARFNYLGSPDGLPTRLGGTATQQATFTCRIPRSVVRDASSPASEVFPGLASLYGHGLLGGQGEIGAGNVESMGNENRVVFCATDWIGMASEDVPNVATILADVSNFPTLADRVQQGMLNFLFLARLMIAKGGFTSDPAFQVGGHPLIDTSQVVYDGNSQGGIIGGALLAVAKDIRKGVLGVPGINYSTLLNRSVDFNTYATFLYNSYPNRLQQQEVFTLMQMLWDRAEGNGYVEHIAGNPYPGTPNHQVLYMPAFGDHQVSTLTTEVAARTAGIPVHKPTWAPGRLWEQTPYWGAPTMPKTPYRGSGLFIWDSGSPTIPKANVPPALGRDPHEHPRRTPLNRQIKGLFLRTGLIYDLCGGPCRAIIA